ncbi:DUF397 domain-containing protein [Streptomyces sp. DH24]|uniref:DUF397 domain-containing protein n=1 Tax=Streptomyces sp. DH24 TaxID=3040123 RepID=UPI002442AD74|nr:DUF397 domain-containing protein [Streptomyces sp. DH24]MDG9720394.1 DUF397 domain-containing protein [Streptomyces sp. DH24]
MTAPSRLQWFKSSYSGGSGTECVECARVEAGVLIRDSKQRKGATLTIADEPWLALIDAVQRGALAGEPPR